MLSRPETKDPAKDNEGPDLLSSQFKLTFPIVLSWYFQSAFDSSIRAKKHHLIKEPFVMSQSIGPGSVPSREVTANYRLLMKDKAESFCREAKNGALNMLQASG